MNMTADTQQTVEAVRKLAVQHAHRVPEAAAIAELGQIRVRFFELAAYIEIALPPSRERALVQTKLDEARMWACNAATLGEPVREPLDADGVLLELMPTAPVTPSDVEG